ncbi:TonB-dependent receptor plug domain-containing protein [Leptolyngbya sp. AN02str]|uniref:TonB-dependent receptor plug domain-containing protein n=1 Tax=Leptolyngbya sp. AN02str TaxID=3423363 RepID=UPI003D31DC01
MMTIFVRLSITGKLVFGIVVGTIAVLCNVAIGVAQPVSPSSASELLEEDEETIRITVTDRILNQPVYAPFRREATVEDSTRPVYVVTREQIEAQGARTVQEALRYLPGILIDGTAGGQLGALSSQFIRGGNSAQVLILLDGRPINDVGFFGGFDLSEFTTDNVERIELFPGGGSTLYGSDALGGVINIVTRSPSAEPEVTVRAAAGSFGLNEQAIQARGTTGDLGWALGYSRIQSNNDFPFEIVRVASRNENRIDLENRRENAEVLYNNLNLSLQGQLGDRNTLNFSALYLTKQFGVAGGVPIPDSIGEFNTLTPEAEQYTDEVLLDLVWRSQLGRSDHSLLTSRVYADFLSYNFNNPDPSTFGTRDDVNRRALGVQVQHSWQFAENQTLTYGVDYRNTRSRNTTFSYGSGTTSVNYDGDISQGALFAQYEVDFTPDFSVNLGLRQDFNSLANGSFTSPSVGARLALSPSTTLRANYARSFRAPQISNLEGLAAFNVVGNPDLQPETGNSFDIGIDQELGEIGLLRLTFFRNQIDNLINFRFGSPSTYENIGRVRTLGLEADLNLQLARNLYAFANYTLNDPRIVRDRNADIEDNQLSFRDADSLNVGLAYETPEGTYGAVVLRSLSRYFVNNTNTESLPGYTTVDFKLRIPLGRTVIFNGNLDNLFDEQYEQYPGYPAVGRSFRVGISARF